jgi:hypothetical protein
MSLTVEVICLIGAIKQNEILLFVSPLIMAILIVTHFFIGQRPKAMTVFLSFTITLLAFINSLMIKKEKRKEQMRTRLDNENIRAMCDIVVTSSGNIFIDKGHRYLYTENKSPPPYDQIDLNSSVK